MIAARMERTTVCAAAEAVNAVETLPPDQKRDYLEMLGAVSVHYMRAMFGDEYTRGWLEHALSDLDGPPLLTLRKPQ